MSKNNELVHQINFIQNYYVEATFNVNRVKIKLWHYFKIM